MQYSKYWPNLSIKISQSSCFKVPHKVTKIQSLSEFFQGLAKMISKTFPKQLFRGLYKRSNAQLLSQSALYIIFSQQKFSRNAMFMGIVPSADLSLRLSQSSCFKVLYERSSEQLLSQGALHLTFYHQNFDKNALLGDFAWSINRRYQ